MHASSAQLQDHPRLATAVSYLEDLVGFDTTSAHSNLEIIAYLKRYFDELGMETTVLYDKS
eukprot:21468-Eustigmatos_ZCMA.PRE.1